jgi:glycosyltransferase involved in cell wall biosynthesis
VTTAAGTPAVATARSAPTLSVIVITKNEAARIARCLGSVAWADQRVVVDCGSTDATPALAADLGAEVVVTPDWPGFGRQKNRALDRAHGDWVLSIDADEWVTPALAAELRGAIDAAATDVVAFELPRSSRYCGRAMRHGGWWPDPVLRVFRRGRARFSDDRVHERVVVAAPGGRVVRLAQPLEHDSFRTLDEVLDKVNRYSTDSAVMLHARGRRGSLRAAIGHGLWAFVRTWIVRRGFLDGREGFMLAVSNAEGAYYRYLKLAQLARPDR